MKLVSLLIRPSIDNNPTPGIPQLATFNTEQIVAILHSRYFGSGSEDQWVRALLLTTTGIAYVLEHSYEDAVGLWQEAITPAPAPAPTPRKTRSSGDGAAP